MSTVALVVRTSRPEARELATDTMTWLAGEGHTTRMLLVDGQDGVSEPDARRCRPARSTWPASTWP